MEQRDPGEKSSDSHGDEDFEARLAHALGLAMGGEQAELARWLGEQGAMRGRLEANLEELAAVGLIGLAAAPERSIGDYRVLETLGRGGMGHVYLALDERLGRKVALKVLRDLGEGDEERVQRFHREAQVVASLHHPNLVTLLNSGESGGVPWLAFEYVEGLTWADAIGALAQHAGSGRLSGAELGRLLCAEDGELPERFQGSHASACLALALDVARGLEVAHRRGVLHRDVKPSNILLDKRGSARLFDFGLASALDDMELTRSTTTLGSRRTMPPEQWNRPAFELDVRVDVYSLGVTLYHALAQRPPFEQTDEVALRQAIEAGRAPRLAELGFSRDLDAVVAHAMEPDRELRYPDITAFAADLERVQNGLPPKVRSVSSPRRMWSWARRKPIHATAWALAFLLLTIVPTLFAIQERRNTRVLDTLLEEQTALRIQADEAAELSNEAFFALSSSIARWGPIDGAISGRVSAALDQAGELLDRAVGVEPLVRARMLASIGQAEISFGYFDDAEKHFLSALELRQAALGPHDNLVAVTAQGLAYIHHLNKAYEQAVPYYEIGLAAFEAGQPEFDFEELLKMRWAFADMCADMGQRERGLAAILADRHLHEDPRVTWTPAERVEFLRQLARRTIELGDFAEAIAIVDEARSLASDALPSGDVMIQLLRQMRVRARLFLDPLGTPLEDIAELRRVLESKLGVRHHETLQAVSLYVRVLWSQDRGEEASQYLRDHRVKLGLPDHAVPIQLELLSCYASYYVGDFERLSRQLELLTPRIENSDFKGLEKIYAEFDLFNAIALDAQDSPDPAAIEHAEERLRAIQPTYAPTSHLVVMAKRYLGRLALHRADPQAAIARFEEALAATQDFPEWLAFYVPELEADLAGARALLAAPNGSPR